MKKQLFKQITLLLALFLSSILIAQQKFDIAYGNNIDAGKYANINGIKMYYEIYGKGEPLFLIHGNGADIKSMSDQIEYFKSKYKVIVADSRGHGKSDLKTNSLTYNLITKDWEELSSYLKLDSVNVLGWSDGGIVGLKMGINNNVKIKNIVAMGANLRPDTTAVHSWAPENVRKDILKSKQMIKKRDTSKDWNLLLQLDEMLVYQPNISHTELKKIKAPTLIMVGDRDIIKNEHAVEMFNSLSKGQLCIMPGINHGAPRNNPDIFNRIVNRFLSEKFKYKPRK